MEDDEFEIAEAEARLADWTYVIHHMPFLTQYRKHVFTAPVWPEIERIYNSGSKFEVKAATDYLSMRYNFYWELEAKGHNLRHLNQYEMAAAQAWLSKLSDRFEQTQAARFGRKGQLVPGKRPKVIRHGWLN